MASEGHKSDLSIWLEWIIWHLREVLPGARGSCRQPWRPPISDHWSIKVRGFVGPCHAANLRFNLARSSEFAYKGVEMYVNV